MQRIVLGLACFAWSAWFVVPCRAAAPNAKEVFEQRIMPIFRSPNPSSCTECHLAGVDLKNYILPSHKRTFVSLRDQGLIDLENPGDSKILRLIAMGGGTNQGAALISAKAEWTLITLCYNLKRVLNLVSFVELMAAVQKRAVGPI